MSICGYDYDDITTDFEEWLDDEKISGRQDALDLLEAIRTVNDYGRFAAFAEGDDIIVQGEEPLVLLIRGLDARMLLRQIVHMRFLVKRPRRHRSG